MKITDMNLTEAQSLGNKFFQRSVTSFVTQLVQYDQGMTQEDQKLLN